MRNWLRNLRETAGLSQEKLATLIQLDITTIGKYELGLRSPSVENAKKIAEILKFDWTRFYEDANGVDKSNAVNVR
jgi:transcriptional regulator with XRE-family HTH domain